MDKVVPLCGGCQSLKVYLVRGLVKECRHSKVNGGRGQAISNKNLMTKAPKWCPYWINAEAINKKEETNE